VPQVFANTLPTQLSLVEDVWLASHDPVPRCGVEVEVAAAARLDRDTVEWVVTELATLDAVDLITIHDEAIRLVLDCPWSRKHPNHVPRR
jgi:hypothetical protein